MDIMLRYVRLLPTLLLIGHINCIEAGGPPSSQLASLFLRLYTGETTEDFLDEHLSDVDTLLSRINDTKPTVVYVHGWSESAESVSVRAIVDGYLHRGDHNVIVADWSEVASQSYLRAVPEIKGVGAAFAEALRTMVNSGFEIEKLHVVGHSLGAQVSGYIGRSLNFTIPRITGLDPAGPLFNYLESPLSAKDAQFVDIIHTDYGFYGIAHVTGTVDFFPNGGRRIQPGCPFYYHVMSKGDFCSHHRSWKFYAESLLIEDSFVAVKCTSNIRFLLGKCKKNEKAIMGFATSVTTKGEFYLKTNSTPPYGLKKMQL
ncbi:lipase member H-A [Cephus cinctus]|uniref:phospholipase A1 n=1 Tax=Cephus cinctus TaxID=211228 RepID=A0AAJ7BKP5_CEPCN|nr:lipase member H-A [Cephus cinctus]